MKPVIIAGIAAIAALGGWVAFKPDATPAFDYAAATEDGQRSWLEAQTRPMARRIDLNLPKGTGALPTMKVSAARVSPAQRRIEIDIAVQGAFEFTADPIAAKRAFGRQFCPGYAESDLGRNGITVLHTFRDATRRPVLIVGVSPVACREHMQG